MPSPPVTGPRTTDCLVIGGGIIGLSIAYELVRTGRTVRLLERGQPGREASWAGAGVLPPGDWYGDHPALDALAAASRPLHAEWSTRLREETGIDDEFHQCGAIYDMGPESSACLTSKFAAWREQGLAVQELTAGDVATLAPELNVQNAYFVPEEAQVRNPGRLTALSKACEQSGVVIESDSAVESFVLDGDRLLAVVTADCSYSAHDYCLAAGAWTGELVERLGSLAPTTPIRGQMLLLRTPEQRLSRIFHHNGRYLVPRRDGRVLVGATVDDTGFSKATVRADIDSLLAFAHHTAPCLRDAEVEAEWAGLRPASADGLPMIGRLGDLQNGWIASGHFRSGLQYAPATAVAIGQMIEGDASDFDWQAFSPSRFTLAANHLPATEVGR